jgi:hypothetical protein
VTATNGYVTTYSTAAAAAASAAATDATTKTTQMMSDLSQQVGPLPTILADYNPPEVKVADIFVGGGTGSGGSSPNGGSYINGNLTTQMTVLAGNIVNRTTVWTQKISSLWSQAVAPLSVPSMESLKVRRGRDAVSVTCLCACVYVCNLCLLSYLPERRGPYVKYTHSYVYRSI